MSEKDNNIIDILGELGNFEISDQKTNADIEKTRAAIQSYQPGSERKWSYIMNHKLTSIAAALVIVIGVFFALNRGGVPIDGATVAWADVVKKLNSFEKYKCHHNTIKDDGTMISGWDVYHINLSLRREERDDGSIYIFDMQHEDVIIVALYPDKKKATVTKMLGFGPKKDPDIIDMVKRFDQSSTQRLGVKTKGGKELYGFRYAPNKYNDFTVWVDTDTKLPVEIELKHPIAGQTIYMDEFEFDFKYNLSDFSTEIPDGYEVETIVKDSGNTKQ